VNSVVGLYAPGVFRETGCDVVAVGEELDSTFPNGVPNPENPEYMEEVKRCVLDCGASVGIFFDGDGDRIGVVDELGEVYGTDRLLMLFSEFILKEQGGGTVLYDIKSTDLLKQHILNLGGVPKLMRTGRTFFLDEMASGAILGAEFSGHVFFADDSFGYEPYFGYDDAIYAALRLVQILDESGKKLSELMSRYPKTFVSPEVRVDCADEVKYDVVERIRERALNIYGLENVVTLDGARVSVSGKGWFLIRASNTAPKLSIRLEGADEAAHKFLLERVQELLDGEGLSLP